MIDTSCLCSRNDNMYGDFPTLSEINRDYEEIFSVIKNVATKGQVIELSEKTDLTIEINGEYPDDFDGEVKSIRYEDYGCLAYIYCRVEKGKVTDVTFDVWSNALFCEFIENTSIGQLENNFNTFMRKESV